VWLWVLLTVFGVVVLFFGGCVALVGIMASNTDSSSVSAADSPAAPTGTAVRDGKFEFVVNTG
jgi:hypothetical protein